MAASLEKLTMLEAFRQKKSPPSFLGSFFRSKDQYIFRSRKAVIDIKRNKEDISIDVVRGTGGNLNRNKRFTTKTYEPPVYNEYNSYFAEELNERMPGATEYDNPEYLSQLLAIITDDQVEVQEKILRAVEKQASDIFLTGTVPLINGDTIDYKQKSAHRINATIDWDEATANPGVEIDAAAVLNRKDGKSDSKIVVFGANAWRWFKAAPNIVAKANFRRIDEMDIKPPVQNVDGAVFHGLFTIASRTYQAWTYPQYYDVPTEAELGLPSGTILNAGTTVPYIPDDYAIVLPEANSVDLRRIHAGIPQLVNRVDPRMQALGISAMPENVRADFLPYALVDQKAQCLNIGVQSAPLLVPVQIDCWCMIDTKVT